MANLQIKFNYPFCNAIQIVYTKNLDSYFLIFLLLLFFFYLIQCYAIASSNLNYKIFWWSINKIDRMYRLALRLFHAPTWKSASHKICFSWFMCVLILWVMMTRCVHIQNEWVRMFMRLVFRELYFRNAYKWKRK